MNLPLSAIKNLELKGIEYRTYAMYNEDQQQLEPAPLANQTVTLVILEDSIGKVQCVLTKDHFIDLTKLCESLGRNLKGIAPSVAIKIAQSHGLETLTSLPGILNYPCVVSPSMLEADTLFFESGKHGIFIQLDKNEIKRLFESAQQLRFTHPIQSYLPPEHHQIAEDEQSIKKAVANFTTLRIKQRLETTLEIPPMPETSRKIIQLRVDPDAGIAELATVVETDPSLAAQVVSWAASPFYAAPGKINSVHDAVIRVLGFDLVINLALGLSLGKSLELPKDNALGAMPYWHQAVYTATTAEIICRQIAKDHRPEPGLAYLSGLLHNFGYLVLGHVFPPHLLLINRYIEVNPHVPINVIEYFLLGLTREQLAAWLFHAWNMPEEIVTAIRWQNTPHYTGPVSGYAHVLYIANQILHSHDFGISLKEKIPHTVLENLKLNPEELALATEKIWNNIAQLDTIAINLSR